MLILGFGNKCQQGKDTAAEAILDFYRDRLSVQRIGFADSLYEVCRKEYGMLGKDAPLLQRIGVERRLLDPDYWVKRAFAKIDPVSDIVVIPDTRFLNEAIAIKKSGGYLVNVSRINEDGSQRIDQSRPADHVSETELDGYAWDFYLKIPQGHQALTGEMAVTLCEYLRSLHE